MIVGNENALEYSVQLESNLTEPAWATNAQTVINNARSDVHSRTLEQDKPPHRCWCGKRKRKGRCKKHAGFTCSSCLEPRRPIHWKSRVYKKLNKYIGTFWHSIYTDRCKSCNNKKRRNVTSRKAFHRIHQQTVNQPGLFTWFITLTKPNIVGVDVDAPSILAADKDLWIEDFHRFRRRQVWKQTFTGGYWFYEVTTRQANEKVFSKSGEYLRTTQEPEINGHLHILANAEGRIPMKELAQAWGSRADFRKPKSPNQIVYYLKGYLNKCSTDGVSMRPFGDIHQRRTSK